MKICRLSPRWQSEGAPGMNASSNPPCVLTIGNFDGVHKGHQWVLNKLRELGQQALLPTCVLSFEPHPRDFFAAMSQRPAAVPARISTLRDKLRALGEHGIDRFVVAPFNQQMAQCTAEEFIEKLLLAHLQVKHVLIGDDFHFGAGRQGDFSLLEAAGRAFGFGVTRMPTQVHEGQRSSSSWVRSALQSGDLATVQNLLGRPYSISGHVVHGRHLGRELGFRTLNLRFNHFKPAASGIFVVQVHGLGDTPLQGVANLGVRPSLDANDVNGGRVLLETHVLDWPTHFGTEEAYGKIIQVNLLHKLHDELRYDSLEALTQGIQKDCDDARAYFAASHTQTRRQTTRDRI